MKKSSADALLFFCSDHLFQKKFALALFVHHSVPGYHGAVYDDIPKAVDDELFSEQSFPVTGEAFAVEAPEAPEKEGYTFDGWFTDVTDETGVRFPAQVTESTEFYARYTKWEVAVHVTFLIDDVVFTEQALLQGGILDEGAVPVPEKKGSAFDRWYLDASLRIPAAFPFTVSEDMKLYAGFNEYGTVTFMADGEVYLQDTFLMDGTDQTVTEPELAPHKDGATFEGWYLDEALKEPVTFPAQVRESVTYYAKMTGALTGAVFSPAGLIAIATGCAAVIGAAVYLIVRKKKKARA